MTSRAPVRRATWRRVETGVAPDVDGKPPEGAIGDRPRGGDAVTACSLNSERLLGWPI